MSILNSLSAAAGGGGGGGASTDLVLIESQVLTGAATNITFSTIPATYKHLLLSLSVKGDDTTNTYATIEVQVGNGAVDTGANYWRGGAYDGESQGMFAETTNVGILVAAVGSRPSVPEVPPDLSSRAEVLILNYANTSYWKNFITRYHQIREINPLAKEFQYHAAGGWRSTAAIDTLKISSSTSTNLVVDSIAALYGVN